MTVRNITAAYRKASEDDVACGLSWYANALSLAHTLDPANPARAAGVIAALSPLTSWPRNVTMVREIYSGQTAKGLPRNIAKALAIYAGALPLDVLSGNKVRSFYLNIMGIDTAESVTIDRHAIDVAKGRVQTDKERSLSVANKGAYAGVVAEYIRAAGIISKESGSHVSAAQIQAITWVYWRRNVIRNNHGDV